MLIALSCRLVLSAPAIRLGGSVSVRHEFLWCEQLPDFLINPAVDAI
jgi:hypothetical protein